MKFNSASSKSTIAVKKYHLSNLVELCNLFSLIKKEQINFVRQNLSHLT